MNRSDTLTVRELIELLAGYPADMPVWFFDEVAQITIPVDVRTLTNPDGVVLVRG